MIFLQEIGFNIFIMEEIWKRYKDIPIYEFSNMGNVRVINTNVYKRFRVNGAGYIDFAYNKKFYLLHRIIATLFVNNKYNKNQVNHKDENKLNNCANNLEWCDSKYNNNYGSHIIRSAIVQSKGHIIEYDNNGNILNKYRSLGYVRTNVTNGASIYSAIFKNSYNRYFNNRFYFTEFEKFDFNRKGQNNKGYVAIDIKTKESKRFNSLKDIAIFIKFDARKLKCRLYYHRNKHTDCIVNNYKITCYEK